MAAIHFYLTPPTGKTFPLKVIYPIMESFSLGGIFKSKDTKHVNIVTPAEGPSFLVAPFWKVNMKGYFFQLFKILKVSIEHTTHIAKILNVRFNP